MIKIIMHRTDTFNRRECIENFNYSTMNGVCTIYAQESLTYNTMNNVCIVPQQDS